MNITKRDLKALYGINQCPWDTYEPRKYHRTVFGHPIGQRLVVREFMPSHKCEIMCQSLGIEFTRHPNISWNRIKETVFTVVDKAHDPYDIHRIVYIIKDDRGSMAMARDNYIRGLV